jgi:hypothetical protein
MIGRTFVVLVPSLFVVACAKQMIVTPTAGKPVEPKPPDCKVLFEDTDDPKYKDGVVPYRDSKRYDDLGVVHVLDAPQEWDDDLKTRLRPEACKLGGDVVLWTLHTPPAIGGSTASFAIYRTLPGAAPPP